MILAAAKSHRPPGVAPLRFNANRSHSVLHTQPLAGGSFLYFILFPPPPHYYHSDVWAPGMINRPSQSIQTLILSD